MIHNFEGNVLKISVVVNRDENGVPISFEITRGRKKLRLKYDYRPAGGGFYDLIIEGSRRILPSFVDMIKILTMAAPPRIDYMKQVNVERGADDTQVSTTNTTYVLLKTVAMTFLTEDKPVQKVAVRMWNSDAAETTTVQLRVSIDGGAEETIETWTTTGTTKVYKSKIFSVPAYGVVVEARFYVKTSNMVAGAFEDITRLHGDEKQDMVYLF